MECSICLESLFEESMGCSVTHCGHIFHQKCIIDWLKTNPSCPKCRKAAFIFELRQVYLEGGGGDDAPKTKKCLKNVAKMNERKGLRLGSNSDEWNSERLARWIALGICWMVFVVGWIVLLINGAVLMTVYGMIWLIRRMCRKIGLVKDFKGFDRKIGLRAWLNRLNELGNRLDKLWLNLTHPRI